MQKKCFPFDIKKSSHQLSKHWLHRKAGMLLQSAKPEFFQSCVKRNLGLWPQLQERDENIVHVSECQVQLYAQTATVSEDLMGTTGSSLQIACGIPSPSPREDPGWDQTPCSGRFHSINNGLTFERCCQQGIFAVQCFRNCWTKGRGPDYASGISQACIFPKFLGLWHSQPELWNRKVEPENIEMIIFSAPAFQYGQFVIL